MTSALSWIYLDPESGQPNAGKPDESVTQTSGEDLEVENDSLLVMATEGNEYEN